jgi:hypothetical protein
MSQKTLVATRADIGQIASALNRHGAREGEQCQNPLGVERPKGFRHLPEMSLVFSKCSSPTLPSAGSEMDRSYAQTLHPARAYQAPSALSYRPKESGPRGSH